MIKAFAQDQSLHDYNKNEIYKNIQIYQHIGTVKEFEQIDDSIFNTSEFV